jgi:type I restriction-modification system DNA methylase subunit
MVALAKPSVLDHVYDPFAGRGGFLIEAWKICEKEASSSIRLSGSEINPVAWARTQVLFSIYGIEADLRLENAFSFRTPMEKPTLILTDPPVFSGKEIGPGNPTPRNTATANLPNSLIGSFVGIDQILSDLYETRGRAFVVVPPRVLFGGGSVARARQIWVIKDCLEAVVTLPRGLFHPVTHLPMALAVFNLGKSNLRKGRVLLIDGEELGRLNLTSKFSSDIFENQSSRILEAFHTFQPIPRFSAIATFEDIKSHDWNLSPKGYLAQPPDPHHHPDLEGLTLQVAQLEAEAEKAQNRFRSSAEDLRTWLKDARTSR